jgi:hypothetical protein
MQGLLDVCRHHVNIPKKLDLSSGRADYISAGSQVILGAIFLASFTKHVVISIPQESLHGTIEYI